MPPTFVLSGKFILETENRHILGIPWDLTARLTLHLFQEQTKEEKKKRIKVLYYVSLQTRLFPHIRYEGFPHPCLQGLDGSTPSNICMAVEDWEESCLRGLPVLTPVR